MAGPAFCATLDVTPPAFGLVGKLMTRAGLPSVSIGAVVHEVAEDEMYFNGKIGEVTLTDAVQYAICREFRKLCGEHFRILPHFAVLMFVLQEPGIDADHVVLLPDGITQSTSTTVLFAMPGLALISDEGAVCVHPRLARVTYVAT